MGSDAIALERADIKVDTALFSEIDLNLIVTFLVIYQERNISRTAEKLGVTQPAVSNALLKLRLHFNDALFERCRHGVRPTFRAELLCRELSPAIDALQTLLKRDRFLPDTPGCAVE